MEYARTKTEALMPKRKAERISDAPVTLRLHRDLVEHLDALVPKVAADGNTATVLGGVSRSSVIRLALVEGVKVLSGRYATPITSSSSSNSAELARLRAQVEDLRTQLREAGVLAEVAGKKAKQEAADLKRSTLEAAIKEVCRDCAAGRPVDDSGTWPQHTTQRGKRRSCKAGAIRRMLRTL